MTWPTKKWIPNRHELTDGEHLELLTLLKAHKGSVVLSGYESDLYNRELASWHREEVVTIAQVATKRRDVLWCNFEPMDQVRWF